MPWKKLSGLLLVAIMVLTPSVGEYARNRIDAAYSAAAEPRGLAPALAAAPDAGFVAALGPTPARISGEGERSYDEVQGIRVVGEPWFRKKIEQALDLLKRKDPENYRLVVENLTEIRADSSITGLGIFARVYPATGVVRYKPWRPELPESVAATLAHEAMHVYAYRHSLPYSGEEGERLANEKWNEVAYRLTRK